MTTDCNIFFDGGLLYYESNGNKAEVSDFGFVRSSPICGSLIQRGPTGGTDGDAPRQWRTQPHLTLACGA